MKYFLLLVICLPALSFPATSSAQRTDKQMSGCAWYYTKPPKAMKAFVSFFDTLRFAPGERIADIGAKGANIAGVLSMFYSHLDITMEDIDSTCLNDEQAAYVLRYYASINGNKEPEDIRLHVVIGNDTSTTLPGAAYQKVFFINTYHEVTKPKQMVDELYRILAPGGILYAQEKLTSKRHIKRKDCGHIMPLEEEFVKQFTDAGFQVLKVNVSETYRQGVVRVRSCWYQFRKA
jgi:ubiquinone/menaquinone biosynthesis C-methylase UbiE